MNMISGRHGNPYSDSKIAPIFIANISLDVWDIAQDRDVGQEDGWFTRDI